MGVNILELKQIPIKDLIPYENNPRKNDNAVPYVMESIKQFGFKNPVILSKDNVIVAGHTRVKAAKALGIKEIPCVYADDLTEEQIKAFRLADNKVSEIAVWDFGKLEEELANIEMDMQDFGFLGDISYIDELLENDYGTDREDTGLFAVTFLFPKDHKAEVMDFIDENGKEAVVEIILKEIKDA